MLGRSAAFGFSARPICPHSAITAAPVTRISGHRQRRGSLGRRLGRNWTESRSSGSMVVHLFRLANVASHNSPCSVFSSGHILQSIPFVAEQIFLVCRIENRGLSNRGLSNRGRRIELGAVQVFPIDDGVTIYQQSVLLTFLGLRLEWQGVGSRLGFPSKVEVPPRLDSLWRFVGSYVFALFPLTRASPPRWQSSPFAFLRLSFSDE